MPLFVSKMQLEVVLFLLAFSCATVRAQTPALEVTDLLSWPPCAQNCIPLGFGPPADCGSLSNLTCLCEEAAFSEQIDDCENSTCSPEERTRVNQLSVELCAPVRGYANATIQPALSSYQATAAPYPTATAPADPANILSYPLCAQICSNETAAPENAPCDPTINECRCGVYFRAYTASCEKITCSGLDYNRTQQLADELCAPLYSSSSLPGPSVTSAIASITSFAEAAVATRDAINLDTWPTCGQACFNTYLPDSGCGSLSNRSCVCQKADFSETTGDCFKASCSAVDYRVITFLALELCNPIGGTGNGSNASLSAALPTPSVFMGGASAISTGFWVGWSLAAGIASSVILFWL